MSFTDAEKNNKRELALSLFTRAMQEFRGGRRDRPPAQVVLWPAFSSVEQAEAEVARISFYLGSHADSIRLSIIGESLASAGPLAVSETDLEGLARLYDSLVLVWDYEGARDLPLRAACRLRIVDPEFHDKCEALTTARLLRWDFATAADTDHLRELSRRRLESFERWTQGSAAVLGTGPGLDGFTSRDVDKYETRVGCNSMVLSAEVLERTKPNVICFGDPVFHFGYSAQAAEFRDGLLSYVESSDPWIFVPLDFGGWVDKLTLTNQRVVPLEMKRRGPFNAPSYSNPWVRRTGNVMTELMVPVALAAAKNISIYGCDGRPPSSDRFWDYGKGVHDEGRYDTAVSAHPSFFRDRRYLRYYEEHCENLEQLLCHAEDSGHTVVNQSQSQIPALIDRSHASLESSTATESHDIDLSESKEVVR